VEYPWFIVLPERSRVMTLKVKRMGGSEGSMAAVAMDPSLRSG